MLGKEDLCRVSKERTRQRCFFAECQKNTRQRTLPSVFSRQRSLFAECFFYRVFFFLYSAKKLFAESQTRILVVQVSIKSIFIHVYILLSEFTYAHLILDYVILARPLSIMAFSNLLLFSLNIYIYQNRNKRGVFPAVTINFISI